jgi:Protein of unknown function (DUF2844)
MRKESPIARDGMVRALWAAAVLSLCVAVPAWASLGGDTTTVHADQLHMQGTLHTTTANGYTVQEIQNSSGLVVREYVSPTGKVFGVAWQGPWPPDMRQLLGNYFDQYTQAAQAQASARPGRRPVMINQPGLVVQIGGHPRAFVGRAYLPDQLPSGVRAEAIR